MKQDHLRMNVAPMFNHSSEIMAYFRTQTEVNIQILRVLQFFPLDVVRASFCRELDLQKYLLVFSALLLFIHCLLHCCASAVSNQPVHCNYKKKYGKKYCQHCYCNYILCSAFCMLCSLLCSALCSALLYALPSTWLPGA